MCTPFPPTGYVYVKKGDYWLMPQVKLLIDLPNCPKGRIFLMDMEGEWFNRRTDKEVAEKTIKHYRFSNRHIIDNPNHFKKIKPFKLV